MPAFLVGAEKAAASAAVGFATGSGLGFVATGDWRSLLYGAGSAVLTGLATYLTTNTPTPTGKHEATS